MVLRAVAVGLVGSLAFVGCVPSRPAGLPSVIVVEKVSGTGTAPIFEDGLTAAGGGDSNWEATEEVDVEWHGSWWPAVILEKRGHRWLVRYDGYASDWDEVVGPERVRERRRGSAVDSADTLVDEPDP